MSTTVYTNGAIFWFGGSLDDDLLARCRASRNIVGVSIAGHLAASVFGAAVGKDIAFVRTETKAHGVSRSIEGVIELGSPAVVFCLRGAESRMAVLAAHGIEVSHSVTVEVVPASDLRVDVRWALDLPEAEPISDLEAFVHVLRDGDFVLSSGRHARVYFDTLPAAHTFRAARHVATTEPVRVGEMVAGVAYGGTYLAATRALLAGTTAVTINPRASACSALSCNTLSVQLYDDFVTTGGSAMSAGTWVTQALGSIPVRNIAMYAKRGFQLPGYDVLRYINRLD